MKKVLGLLLTVLISTFLVAFSWPWEEEDKPTISSPKKVVSPQPKPPVEKTKEEGTASEASPVESPAPAETAPEIALNPNLQKTTRLLTQVKKAGTQIKPQPVTLPPVSRPVTAQRMPVAVPDPSIVSSEIQQVIQLNKKRQMELTRQIRVLNETTKRAKLYNKILNNMYPTSVTRNLAVRAVTQEKVRLIHQEIKKLGAISVQTVPIIHSANQAKAIAIRSSQAGLLPIGLLPKLVRWKAQRLLKRLRRLL